jgi:hypothetical protein
MKQIIGIDERVMENSDDVRGRNGLGPTEIPEDRKQTKWSLTGPSRKINTKNGGGAVPYSGFRKG